MGKFLNEKGLSHFYQKIKEYANFKNYIDLQNKSGSKITVVMVHKRLNQSTGGESSTSAPDSDELIGEISICQLEAGTNEKAEIPITFGESIFAFW